MDLLDHQLGQVFKAIVQVLFLVQLICGDVFQDRLFGHVKADHFGYERIDRLVVGNARSDRVRQGDPPRAVSRKQSRDAQHRIGAKRARVEEVVVDATVQHVDTLGTARRAHID